MAVQRPYAFYSSKKFMLTEKMELNEVTPSNEQTLMLLLQITWRYCLCFQS